MAKKDQNSLCLGCWHLTWSTSHHYQNGLFFHLTPRFWIFQQKSHLWLECSVWLLESVRFCLSLPFSFSVNSTGPQQWNFPGWAFLEQGYSFERLELSIFWGSACLRNVQLIQGGPWGALLFLSLWRHAASDFRDWGFWCSLLTQNLPVEIVIKLVIWCFTNTTGWMNAF